MFKVFVCKKWKAKIKEQRTIKRDQISQEGILEIRVPRKCGKINAKRKNSKNKMNKKTRCAPSEEKHQWSAGTMSSASTRSVMTDLANIIVNNLRTSSLPMKNSKNLRGLFKINYL